MGLIQILIFDDTIHLMNSLQNHEAFHGGFSK